MEPRQLLQQAMEGFGARLDAVRDDGWHHATPCEQWDVRALANHVTGEVAWISPLLDGATIEDVGDRLDGDLLGDDPAGAWGQACREALDRAGAEGVLDRPVDLSYGTSTGAAYLAEVTSDIVIHTWDLARATGGDEHLDPDLVEVAWATLAPSVQEWRSAGVFGPAVDVPADADPQTRLLALSGRQPDTRRDQ